MILTGENRRTRRKTYPSATLSTTNPTWTDLGANPCLRGENPVTNRLNYATGQWSRYDHSSQIQNFAVLNTGLMQSSEQLLGLRVFLSLFQLQHTPSLNIVIGSYYFLNFELIISRSF
jgi:hypothetical protein